MDSVDIAIRELYEDGYYRTIFELQKGIGVGASFAKIDANRLDMVLVKPWTTDGKTFSDRIWGNKNALLSELHTQLAQTMIRGDPLKKAVEVIQNQFQVKQYQARRLVRTESAFFSSASRRAAFQELGVERFIVVSTLDGLTCSGHGSCGSLDGIPMEMKLYEVGVTAPPFHPNCRCTACPYFEDEFTLEEMRAARNLQTGKTYLVPATMKFEKWREIAGVA